MPRWFVVDLHSPPAAKLPQGVDCRGRVGYRRGPASSGEHRHLQGPRTVALAERRTPGWKVAVDELAATQRACPSWSGRYFGIPVHQGFIGPAGVRRVPQEEEEVDTTRHDRDLEGAYGICARGKMPFRARSSGCPADSGPQLVGRLRPWARSRSRDCPSSRLAESTCPDPFRAMRALDLPRQDLEVDREDLLALDRRMEIPTTRSVSHCFITPCRKKKEKGKGPRTVDVFAIDLVS